MRSVILILAALLAYQPVLAADPAKDAERRKLEAQLKEAKKRRSDAERAIKGTEHNFKLQDGNIKNQLDRQRKGRDWMQKQFDQQIKGQEERLGRIRKAQVENDAGLKKANEDFRQTLARRADLRRRYESRANEKQLQNQDIVIKKQAELNAAIEILRKALEEDEAKLEKLAQEEKREESQLVRQDATQMQMVKAFELAKQLEQEITRSYKDIKATETAIARKMSFKAASKITDVAQPERMEANVEAIELKPRTKEDLDRQKQAQKEIVAETDNMLDATMKMMDEAMEIVMAGDKSQPRPKQKSKQVKWLEKKDFETPTAEERLAQMESASEFQVQMDSAAAEDDSRKAKDLAAMMSEMNAAQKESAESAKKASAAAAGSAGSAPPPLDPTGKDALMGNVMQTAGTPKDDVLPAKWMYVSSWYVIGPFPNPNRVNLRRKFPPESVVDLNATYAGKDGRVLKWQFMQTKNRDQINPWGGVDHNAPEIIPDKSEEYAIYYAYAEVFFDEECDRWIAIGSDDRSDVWINGFHVWGSSNKLKGWKLNEDYRRVHFQKGRNRILLRCENGHWNVGWSLCIATGDAQTL